MRRGFFPTLLFLSLFYPLTLSYSAMTLKEEERYGREIHREIVKGAKLNTDFFIGFYAEQIKRRLEDASRSPYPLKLTVIESKSADAFATLGGYIYLTTALIALCENESELAGVIAHEIAHVKKRHVSKKIEREKHLNIGRMATLILGSLVGDPKAKEAIIVSGMGALQSLALTYSREDEQEADLIGSTILEEAGFRCTGISSFLKRLRLGRRDSELPQYLLTHPYHEERISRLESICRRNEGKEKGDELFPYIARRAFIVSYPSKVDLLNTYRKKYEDKKEDPILLYSLALLSTLVGKKDEALTLINEGKGRMNKLFLAELLYLNQRYKEAIDLLNGEDSPYANYILARTFEEIGELKRAVEYYGKILKYGDSFPEIFLKAGMVYGRLGEEARGFEYLGRYYLSLGQEVEARSYFEKAVSKYGPNSEEAKELIKILKTIGRR